MSANLRVCARCEWVFRRTEFVDCPKCHFAHYSARRVYGHRAYRYQKTQEPWLNKKIETYTTKLLSEHVWPEENKKNTSRITHASRGAGGLLLSDCQSKEFFQYKNEVQP